MIPLLKYRPLFIVKKKSYSAQFLKYFSTNNILDENIKLFRAPSFPKNKGIRWCVKLMSTHCIPIVNNANMSRLFVNLIDWYILFRIILYHLA